MTDLSTARLKMDDNIVMQLGNKLYNQPKWLVLMRELMQNALDAEAKNITVSVDRDFLIFQDDGVGMNKNALLNTFLTVGGTEKDRNNKQTVGGFGIAKLAIFSCEDFEVKSGSWALSKEILTKHHPLTKLFDDDVINGTRVYIYNPNLFGFYCSDEQVKMYLSGVNREIRIRLNEELIQKATPQPIILDNVGAINYIKPYSSYITQIMVRSNGIPLFYHSMFGDYPGGAVILYDVNTDLAPYDDDYPFSTTRETFIPGNEESTKFTDFCAALSKQLARNKKFEEERKEALTQDPETGLWTMFNASVTNKGVGVVQTFKSNIELLCTLYDVDYSDFQYGLVGENEGHVRASITKKRDDETRIFFISENCTNKSEIIASAIHEFTHIFHEDHYEEFATKMTEVVGKYISVSMAMMNSYSQGTLV